MVYSKGDKVLGVDPGDKRIGIAISDETGSLARPLQVILHEERGVDARRIIDLAAENLIKTIVVGAAYGSEGEETPSSRKAARLADAIRATTDVNVILWDETGSTKHAREPRLLTGTTRRARKGHQDASAAAWILQDFLDAGRTMEDEPREP